MFDDLFDAVSCLWSWRWPEAVGQIPEVEVERIQHNQGGDTCRLAVAYKFSLGADGPYTGESFWTPAFFVNRRVIAARYKFHIGQPVVVRYRPDDPSVNKLDRRMWQNL
ncbi:MAG: DUF3592 domain-containing protein [Terriglobales bacterium]